MSSSLRCLYFLFVFGLSTLSAAVITIDFERFPGPDSLLGSADDELAVPNCGFGCPPVENQYASVGLTFIDPVMVASFFIPTPLGPPGNHYLQSTSAIEGLLSIPVFEVSLQFNAFSPTTLTAFNTSNDLLDTVTIDPGFHAISVSAAQPIARFLLTSDGGNPFARTVQVDNLTLDTSPGAPIPEPSAFVFLVSTLLVKWGGRLVRSRPLAGCGV